MTPTDRLRLFIAAPVPRAWHRWLGQAQHHFEHALPGYFRMTRPETWHLTVLFLGSQPTSALEMIGQAVERVARDILRFELTAGDLGAPGQLDRPRLVWLRCDDDGVLESAQRQLIAEIRDLDADSAPFRAHVTLGRARKPSRVAFREALEEINRLERPSAVTVDRLVLFRSHLERSGARYEPLLECHLR